MSRRIQIYQVTVSDSTIAGYTHTQLNLVVFGPGGRAEMEGPDPEMILLAVAADVVGGAGATIKFPWKINGVAQSDAKNRLVEILQGGRPIERRNREEVEMSRALILDAAEFIDRGQVLWNVTTPKVGTMRGVLYPAELLRAVTEAIFKRILP